MSLLRHFFGDLYVRLCAFAFTIGLLICANTALFEKSASPTPGRGESQSSKKITGWTTQMVLVTASCLLLQFYWFVCQYILKNISCACYSAIVQEAATICSVLETLRQFFCLRCGSLILGSLDRVHSPIDIFVF